jgi:hypothetical protein
VSGYSRQTRLGGTRADRGVRWTIASLRQAHRRGRSAALAALTAALLVLLSATNASAEVVRLRVDWAPSDGRSSMHPPYLGAAWPGGGNGYQRGCPAPSYCEWSGTRWIQENLDAGGDPRTLSFVDETATQYRTFSFTIAHPFGGFGPNIVGTATITHADGRSYTVSFDIPPGPGSGLPTFASLGDSQGLPRPQAPSPETSCTISDLEAFANFRRLLRASISDFARRWRTGDRLLFNNIYACGKGKITARVVRPGRGRPVLIAKGKKILDYRGPGRAGTKVTLTQRGRALRARGTKFRAKVALRVFDADGASITYSGTTALRGGGGSATTPPR